MNIMGMARRKTGVLIQLQYYIKPRDQLKQK